MASNKFFTWTKGDRKHVSTGMIPIPIEYISIKGMEHGRTTKRSSKAGRKPISLDFARDFGPNTSSRSSDSIALHDAAIKSATSLIAVMNDMLKSPPPNAHFLSAQQAEGSQPWHGRPRSRTAPSTPMFEAPGMEPAELEGSIPAWPEEHRCGESTPLRPLHLSAAFPRRSCDSYSRTSANLRASGTRTPRKQTSSYRQRKPSTSHTSNTSEDTLVGSENDPSPFTRRPSLKDMQAQQVRSDSAGCVTTTTQPITEEPMTAPPTYDSYRPAYHPTNTDELIAQIMALRASHDAHIESLKKAHDRDVESHRSYIDILERQQASLPKASHSIKGPIAVDTASTTGITNEVQASIISSNNPTKSGRRSIDSQSRASSDLVSAEIEALKLKLSLANRMQAEYGEVKTERDLLRDLNGSNEGEILQLKSIVRKAKDSENSMLEKIAGLEAALCIANAERTDVLEGFYEARNRARSLSDQQKLLIEERDQARERLSSMDPQCTASISASTSSGPGIDTAAQQQLQSVAAIETQQQELDDLRRILIEKDARIRELTRLNLDTTGIEENEALIRQLEACQNQLSTAQADRDQYNDLLHAELRRQSRSIAIKLKAATPQINDEARSATTQRLQIFQTELDDQSQRTAEQRCQYLERELKHLIQEIVLYKMDVRGYKKDLKKARAQIDSMKSQQQRPPTPNSLDSSVDSSRPSLSEQDSGLGIYLAHQPEIDMPTRHLVPPRKNRHSSAATSRQREPATTTIMSTPSPAPPRSARLTPAVHKELPATPSVPTAHYPSTEPDQPIINRAETIRSLSDSIISSYAKRGTPETISENFPPPLPLSTARWRSTGPAAYVDGSADASAQDRSEMGQRGASAVAVPVLRFRRGMVRTPVLG